jgi:glutamate racemase
MLSEAILPLIDQGVDTLVLACTHYPLVLHLIREIAGPNIQVIDPAPAIARQTKRIWDQLFIPPPPSGEVLFFSTGNAEKLQATAKQLINLSGSIVKVKWHGTQLSTLFQD